ncbi:MAG: selenide, water dikinase SelD [Candidatus Dadabacteria bacterium]|nr:MAG: selenide, water dikinase SelD [Candidatus Dadabacteria bacterium]
MNPTSDDIRLTQFSHGAGCGCKIAPRVLDEILSGVGAQAADARLLVGNGSRDDAGAWDLGDGRVLLSTTDFFMPIVDDPREFGAIAATNALSDIYAMGGRPCMALAVLGWPIDKIPAAVAGQVVAGARAVCDEAGAMLAGGHSIDSPEPIFGLAVNGLVEREHLKRNDQAQPGDLLYLTKALGVGILTTAEKRGTLRAEDRGLAAASMLQLNRIGAEVAAIDGVHAITDVTGFGLGGHLREMSDGSGVQASVELSALRLLSDLASYIRQGCVPGGTQRNFDSYGDRLGEIPAGWLEIVCDPQTSGGLLMSVAPNAAAEVEATLRQYGLEEFSNPIGKMGESVPGGPAVIFV